MPETNVPVGTWEKIAYGLGDTATNLVWRTLMVFLPIFYTDVFGLSAAGIAIAVFSRYPLSDSTVTTMTQELAQKREVTP
jgi:GPH family glycoside/pentoside/hexuronide:cation symporter